MARAGMPDEPLQFESRRHIEDSHKTVFSTGSQPRAVARQSDGIHGSRRDELSRSH